MSPAVRAVRDQWYERLAREGFHDLEMRRSNSGQWYETPTYTYAHGEVSFDGHAGSKHSGGPGHVGVKPSSTNVRRGIENRSSDTSVWDLPIARHFREVDAAIEALPRRARPQRKLLRLYSMTGNLLGAARTLGLTRQQARTLLKQALRYARHAGGDDDGEASDSRR